MSTPPSPGGGGFGCLPIIAALVFVGLPLLFVLLSQGLTAVGR